MRNNPASVDSIPTSANIEDHVEDFGIADPGETDNRYDAEPDTVRELTAMMDACRKDLGDEATGVAAENVRPIGRVDNPNTLTHFDPDHPYIIALYDLKDRG